MAKVKVCVREVENYLSPKEAGEVLGTTAQWVKQLARREQLAGVETHLGWLIDPEDLERLARERLEKAERKISRMKSARTSSGTYTVSGRSMSGRARARSGQLRFKNDSGPNKQSK